MSTRHENFTVLFSGEGYDGTICKYREGHQWDELKTVICDAWGPARFNYECHGMALPVNSNQSFVQFIERLHRGEVETMVTETNGTTYPVLRCMLLPNALGGGSLSAHQQQPPVLAAENASDFQMGATHASTSGADRAGMLRPVKPRVSRPADGSGDELQEPSFYRGGNGQQQQQQQQPQQQVKSSAGGTSSNIHRFREGPAPTSSSSMNQPGRTSPIPEGPPRVNIAASAAAAGSSSSSNINNNSRQQQQTHQSRPQQQQQQSNQEEQETTSPRDDLENTQKSSSSATANQQRTTTSGSSSKTTKQLVAHQPPPPPAAQRPANDNGDAGGASSVLNAAPQNTDTLVCAVRTRVPPVCIQVRVDQGGLIGNLRAHIADVAFRNANIELPPNFLLSFSRPDCETAVDVEDDSEFNFLKASIKRLGPEAVVLFADVKSGSNIAVGNAADFSSPLKANPFARSKSQGGSPAPDPMNDAARHLI